MVGPPKVINKKVDDQLLEPYEVSFQSSFNCIQGKMLKDDIDIVL